jgi:hypothetical protein
MNDRRAAEAVGLNPDTASYTKSKPRVRAYMIEHRAAVEDRLVDQEVGGLRKLKLGRDQILDRLWELANLSSEATRGSITGQMKALSMIVAIEGLIPDRRSSPSGKQPAASPVKPPINTSAWRSEQQHQPVGEETGYPGATREAQPAAPQPAPARRGVPEPEPAPNPVPKTADRNQPSLPDLLIAQALNRVPRAANGLDAFLATLNPPRQPFSISPFTQRR